MKTQAQQTLLFLANYNSWRRGDETLEMPSPAEIGATIDDAVNLLRKHDKLELERDQLRAELATCKDASQALVESLRAEVERLKPYVSKAVLTHEGTMLCSPLVAVKFNEQTARAERAELELHALRLICGTTDANKFSTWVDRANARAEKAEAELAKAKAIIASIEEDGTEEHNAAVRLRQELAADRARLDWLMAGGVCMVQHSGGFYVSRLHAQVSRAVIDAAMKEGSA